MRRIIKYIISFIFILIVACSGLLCSAAVIETNLDSDQMRIILNNASGTNFNNLRPNSNYWGYKEYTDRYSGATYYMYGNSSSYRALTSSTQVLNLPLYFSGFDSITIEFVVMSSYSSNYSYFKPTSMQRVLGSTATSLSYTQIGTASLYGVNNPLAANATGSEYYYGFIYQVTISDPIDYLRINLSDSDWNDYSTILFGFAGFNIVGASQALANIETQVSQIGGKVDALTSAVQNATSDIGAIVDGQGNILTAIEDIKEYASSIDEKQDVIIYATDDDQLIISEFNERLSEVKDQLEEYKGILDQYYNPPDVNNVTNIIDQGLPNEYNPQTVAPVLSVIFDNSLVTTILIAVLALATMSYVLFGKKG